MARIRSIKPEFWVSEQVAECSTNARLTFIGMWGFCDDRGVHPAKPKTLKAELFPMDDFSAGDIATWVAELVAVGLIAEFTSEGVQFWHVTGWDKHQKIDRPSFKYPAPPHPNSDAPRRPLAEDSANTRRAPPPGVESSGVESKGEEKAHSPKAQPAAPVGERPARKRAASSPKPCRPEDVSEPVWADWIELRRAKRAPVSRTVLEGAASEAKKAGMSLEDFLRVWCRRGSQGLEADWLKPNERQLGHGSTVRSALHADDMIGGAS